MAYNWNWGVFLQPTATGDDTYLGWMFYGFKMTITLSLSAWLIALAVGGPSSRITTKLQLIMDSFGEIGVPIKACGQLPRPVQSDWPLLTATEPFV